MLLPVGTVSNQAKQNLLRVKAQNRITEQKAQDTSASAAAGIGLSQNTAVTNRVSSITAKLKSGKKLTVSEMAFLRKHAPDLFQKAVKIARERAAYRESLERAKSKEEVNLIHQGKLGLISTEARYKGADMDLLDMRTASLADERARFATEGKYRRLKNEAAKKRT